MDTTTKMIRQYLDEFYESEDPGEFSFDIADVKYLMIEFAKKQIDSILEHEEMIYVDTNGKGFECVDNARYDYNAFEELKNNLK